MSIEGGESTERRVRQRGSVCVGGVCVRVCVCVCGEMLCTGRDVVYMHAGGEDVCVCVCLSC